MKADRSSTALAAVHSSIDHSPRSTAVDDADGRNFPRRFELLLALALCLPAAVQAQQVVVEFDIVGLNANQADVNATLNDACASITAAGAPNAAQADLLNTCAILGTLDEDLPQLAAGLDRLVPEEAFVVSDSLTDAADVQLSNVRSRIRALQREQSGATAASPAASGALASTWARPSGGGASASDPLGGRLQLFVGGYVSSGEYDARELQQDTEIGASNVALGLDYRIGERFVVGAALGFLRNESDFRRGPGGMSADSVDATLFGLYSSEDASYVDVALDIGRGRYELERRISLVGAEDVIASADTDVSTLSLSGSIGRRFPVGAWSIDPYARAGVTIASVDGYRETADSTQPGFGSTLQVSSQSIRSGTLSLGGQLSRAIGTPVAVIVPQLSVELLLETQSDKDGISASFVVDPDRNLLSVEGDERDTRSASVGAGGSAVFADGKSAYVYVDTRLLHDYLSQTWLKAGFRWEFS